MHHLAGLVWDTKELGAMNGVVIDRILGKFDFEEIAVTTGEKVDCGYIVTLGTSPNLIEVLSRVAKAATQVVVLHTLDIPVATLEKLAPNLRVKFLSFGAELHNAIFGYRSSENPTCWWTRGFDVPSKRNFALRHAASNGYRHALLVDDDIHFSESFVSSALHVIDSGVAEIVSAYSLDSADVSVVDRVIAEVRGEPPGVSISGNATVVRICPQLAFFPYVYNEDWIFFWASINYGGARAVAIQEVRQLPPREGRTDQVQMEQFGELISHAIFFGEKVCSDLTRLKNEQMVAASAADYRREITELPFSSRYHHFVEAALEAIDRIAGRDIRRFAEDLEQDLLEHYGTRPK